MTSESINHVNYYKKEKSVEIPVKEDVSEQPVAEAKVEEFEASDVNEDGVTDLKDAVEVVSKIWKKSKKKKRKR